MTLECKRPCTWGSRAWPWPLRGRLIALWAAWAGSHSRPGGSDQSPRLDISLSSVQCHGLSECIWKNKIRSFSRNIAISWAWVQGDSFVTLRVWDHRASPLPARWGRTGWGCPLTRRQARGRVSCPVPVCSAGPARSARSGWTCPGCNPRQPRRKTHFPWVHRTKRSRRPWTQQDNNEFHQGSKVIPLLSWTFFSWETYWSGNWRGWRLKESRGEGLRTVRTRSRHGQILFNLRAVYHYWNKQQS